MIIPSLARGSIVQVLSIAVETFSVPQHVVRFNPSFDGYPNPRAYLLYGPSPESIIQDLFEKPALDVKANQKGEVCITVDRSYGSSIRSKDTRQPGEIMFLQEFMKHARNLRGCEMEDFGWKIRLFFLKVQLPEKKSVPLVASVF